MTENTKKWLTVAGCLVVCAILVAVIASSFSKDKVTDDLLPPSSSQQGDVVVDPDSSTPPPAESGDDQKPGDNVTVNPETPDASTNTDDGNGADFTGTEQTIQPDPVKPEYTEDELKDPTKTPDGTPVEGTPEPQDHNNVTPPPEQPSTNTSGGLPGFDNVPNAGANQGGSIDSDGDMAQGKKKDPEFVIARDQRILRREIAKWTRSKELALQQISHLREILELSQKARAYLMTASADLILQLYNGENWGAHPELAYIYKMRELF